MKKANLYSLNQRGIPLDHLMCLEHYEKIHNKLIQKLGKGQNPQQLKITKHLVHTLLNEIIKECKKSPERIKETTLLDIGRLYIILQNMKPKDSILYEVSE
jgi:hypothetical protein